MKLFFLIVFSIYCIPEYALAQRPIPPAENYGHVEDESELKPWENIDEKIRKNFFLRAEVTKKECFVGEPLMAVFKAYSRLDANSQVVKRPSLTGFSVIEMVDAYNNQPEVEKYNGNYFYMHLIRKVQLFPLQPGTFTLEPAEVESVIHMREGSDRHNGLRNLRDIFRRGRRNNNPSLEKQITFQTPPVTIQVNPLPEKDQPEEFTGAVGNFSAQLQMKDTAATSGEPTLVQLVIKGSGNFPLVTDPVISWPEGVEASPPTVTEKVNKYNYPLSGTKTFQYTLEHRDTGTHIIPPVVFSFFDPASKSYEKAVTDPVVFTVAPAGTKKNKFTEKIISRSARIPLHYYYFSVIVIVIICFIIYQLRKPEKKS